MFTGNTKSHQETQTVSYTGFKQKVKSFPELRWWQSHRGSSSNRGLWTTGRPACQGGGSRGMCIGEMQLKWARRSEACLQACACRRDPRKCSGGRVAWRWGREWVEGDSAAHPAVKGDCPQGLQRAQLTRGESRAEQGGWGSDHSGGPLLQLIGNFRYIF